MLDSLLERLQLAGWIETVVRRPAEGEITSHFSKVGRTRMRQLKAVLRELDQPGDRLVLHRECAALFAFVRALPPIPPEAKNR